MSNCAENNLRCKAHTAKVTSCYFCCMKSILITFLLWAWLPSFGQADTAQAPYKRFPSLPPLQMLLADSATKYTKENIPKRKPVLVMLFSPECSHCQHTAEELVQHKEELKNIHIIMSTLHPLAQMNEFVENYGLKELKNVVVGRDVYYILPSFYAIKNLPYMAFYNQKGNLIMGFEGSMPISRVLEIFRHHK